MASRGTEHSLASGSQRPETQHSAGGCGRNAEIIRRRRDGVGPREIARQMGLSPNVVAGVLKRAGDVGHTDHRGGWHNGYPDDFKARVVELAERLTTNAAAAHFGLAWSTVAEWQGRCFR
jgi:transposase-like protein